MSWQVALGLIVYVSWLALHSWLAKKRHKNVLLALMAIEMIAFIGLTAWALAHNTNPSVGGAVVLAIFVFAALLLLPIIVGATSLWRNRITRTV